MRILFCNYEYPPLGGGGGVLNAHLAEELADRHEVTVLTSGALGTPDRETRDGVDIVRVPVFGRSEAAAANMASMASYLPMGVLKGRKLVREKRFDVINTHFVLPTGPVGSILARTAKIPNVLTVHGGDLYDPSKSSSPHRHASLRMAVRSLLRKADSVVGQSQNTIDNVHQYYLPEQRCELIPLGIKRRALPESDRSSLGIAADEFVMVTIGRLVSRKAVNQLIDMMKSLQDRAVRLVVIGDGPLKKDLEEQASSLGVSAKVTFAGFVSDEEKAALLAASDLYVSTSQHEGFGLVFLEGMSAGIPVVCYNFGGQTDFLDDGLTGALVPLNDLSQFTNACVRFMDSPEDRIAAGKENLQRVESFYIDTCAQEYERLFASVIEQHLAKKS
jgi:glycosyltransferase involved in cell wall biosynthesis